MLKKALALTLAAVMLLMPMTASAVTWGEIQTVLQNTNRYRTGDTLVTKDGNTITVEGGNVEEIYINETGNYVFNGVTIGGETLVVGAYDGKVVTLTLNKDTKFNTTLFGVDISVGEDGKVIIHNDTEIVGNQDSLWIGYEGGTVQVDGSGTIRYNSAYDEDKNNADSYSPVEFSANLGNWESSEEMLNAVKNSISIDQTIVTAGNVQPMHIYCYSDDDDTYMEYYVNQNGELYQVNEDGTATLIDANFLKEEEEPYVEPDPVEVQRQLEGIGGVTTSPVWNWQGYLGHSSKPMWIYVNGEKTLMRQQLFWLGDSTKNHTCRVNVAEPDPASIELRVGLDMLRTAKRAEISVISILDKENNPVAQFAVSDLMAAFEQYGLVEGELLCVSADADAEVMKVTLEGEYLPLEEKAE